MNTLKELNNSLLEASRYFESRGFYTWSEEAEESITQLNKGDKKLAEKLLLKYAPTCEVESLFITEYDESCEMEVIEKNEQLSGVIQNVYWALEHFLDEST